MSDFKIGKRYKLFLQTDSEVDVIEGTTFAGKTTTAVATKVLYMIKKTKRKKHIIAGKSLGVIMSNIINTGEFGLADLYPSIGVYPDGGKKQKLPHLEIGDDIVYLVGYDNVARFKTVLGGQFGVIYVDEMNIASETFINEVFLPRFEYFCGTANPDDPRLPIYKNVMDRARPAEGHEIPNHIWKHLKESKPREDWHYWFFTYDDNPSVTPEKKKNLLSSLLPGTIQYKNKIQGIRAKSENLIFGDLPKDIIVNEVFAKGFNFNKYTAAIDTSYSKNTEDTNAFGFGGITTTGEYFKLDELVVNNKDVGKIIHVNGKKFRLPLSASDVCMVGYEFLEENNSKWGFSRYITIDSPATTLEFDKMRRLNGWVYMPVDANKIKMKVKIIDRIKFVNAWIAKRKYYILEHCKNHIHEMESWSFDSKGKPEDYGNHTIDETSYEWIPERDKIK